MLLINDQLEVEVLIEKIDGEYVFVTDDEYMEDFIDGMIEGLKYLPKGSKLKNIVNELREMGFEEVKE